VKRWVRRAKPTSWLTGHRYRPSEANVHAALAQADGHRQVGKDRSIACHARLYSRKVSDRKADVAPRRVAVRRTVRPSRCVRARASQRERERERASARARVSQNKESSAFMRESPHRAAPRRASAHGMIFARVGFPAWRGWFANSPSPRHGRAFQG